MRLDKFLKVSRLIKRRTLAKQICDAGRVTVNDRTAKASTAVAVGDALVIGYGNKVVTVEVRKLADHPRREEAPLLYNIVSTVARQKIDADFVDDVDES